ncbi:hypothetical protein K431DRAFT_288639 [Polychaeton citri CBS 116435]|uniref:Mediator of RNA polymerase II transcription subunit 22 n=1 Tax=Polychaeton citri CBS 116435 TaxID=1314669 RepID=A0A9P4Q0Q2_9PEZI|nr:hypothetical protein K431DRAFT_288639 [Polychaeton citri CBS 116435]
MDAPLRNSPALIGRIDKLRDELIKRYESVVELAGIERNDRNTSAVSQFQMRVDTAALIRAAEDLQSLIRQLQEMWLFGHLSTLGESKIEQQTDETAGDVARLLQQLAEKQQPNATPDDMKVDNDA